MHPAATETVFLSHLKRLYNVQEFFIAYYLHCSFSMEIQSPEL